MSLSFRSRSLRNTLSFDAILNTNYFPPHSAGVALLIYLIHAKNLRFTMANSQVISI